MAKKSKIHKAKSKAKFSTREKNRCFKCGRPHGYLRRFGLCRICFRERAGGDHGISSNRTDQRQWVRWCVSLRGIVDHQGHTRRSAITGSNKGLGRCIKVRRGGGAVEVAVWNKRFKMDFGNEERR